MPSYSNLVQVRENEATKNLKLSKESAQILEVLNELENFTIAVRKQVLDEVRSATIPIHLNLESFNRDRNS